MPGMRRAHDRCSGIRRVAGVPLHFWFLVTCVMPVLVASAAGTRVAHAASPADSTTAARADSTFNFVYTGWGQQIDTFHGEYTRDLDDLRDTTIALVLSRAEMDSVLAKMLAIGFFAMPEPHPPYPPGTTGGEISPHSDIHIEARRGTLTRRLDWTTGFRMERPVADWQRLFELETMIRAILANRQEAKALPERSGGWM